MKREDTLQSSNARRIATGITVLALGVFVLHFPGQASYDTLAQAHDGATRVYTSNQPPAMSLILSVLTLPGVLALQIALFSLAVLRLLALNPGSLRTQYKLMTALYLFPVLLIYVGIVWKDVLFAHGALLAFLLLHPDPEKKRYRSLAASAIVLALAVAVRQQAAIIAVLAVIYLVLGDGSRGLRSCSRWKMTCLWIAVFTLCSAGVRFTVQASGDTTRSVAFEGPIRQLAMFDLGGILYRVPDLDFPAIAAGASATPEAHRPTRERIVELLGLYSAQRQDFMAETDAQTSLWIPTRNWLSDWRTNILREPTAYLLHRVSATSWLLGCHEVEKCLPYAVGITSEPQQMVASLDVTPGLSHRARLLSAIGKACLFLFQPWIYVCFSLVIMVYLCARSLREHALMITLQTSGLLYAASYFLIGFACDFRYTYFSTVTALFGVAYVIGMRSRSGLAKQTA